VGAFAEVAPQLHERGLNVVPAADKRAIAPWTHLQVRRQTASEMHALLRQYPDADPAVVLGRGSGVVDVDVDSPTAEDEMLRLGLPLPPTSCFASRRGPHRLYRCADPLPKRLNVVPGADFLGQGSIVVVPPAVGRHWHLGLEHMTDLPAAWHDRVLQFRTTRESPTAARPSHPPDTSRQDKKGCAASYVYTQLAAGQGLEQWFSVWEVVQACAAVLAIPSAAGLGEPFLCVLPCHVERRPSAALWRDRDGCIQYHDFHGEGELEWLTLSEVFAGRISGRVRKLHGVEGAVWMARLLNDAGVIELPNVKRVAPLLSLDAPAAVRRIANGFDLLRRCRALHDGAAAPAPFSWRFASSWCTMGERQAGKAMLELIRLGHLRKAGRYRTLSLFLPGG
jgi:hypothetical protein